MWLWFSLTPCILPKIFYIPISVRNACEILNSWNKKTSSDDVPRDLATSCRCLTSLVWCIRNSLKIFYRIIAFKIGNHIEINCNKCLAVNGIAIWLQAGAITAIIAENKTQNVGSCQGHACTRRTDIHMDGTHTHANIPNQTSISRLCCSTIARRWITCPEILYRSSILL